MGFAQYKFCAKIKIIFSKSLYFVDILCEKIFKDKLRSVQIVQISAQKVQKIAQFNNLGTLIKAIIPMLFFPFIIPLCLIYVFFLISANIQIFLYFMNF